MAARVDYNRAAPEGLAKLRALEHWLNTGTGLERVLAELVRLRVSLLNGCEYCIELHRGELAKLHEPAERIAGVAEWRSAGADAGGAYTQRERAALAWAEAVTNIQDGHAPDAVYDQLREHFDEAEAASLTLLIATINAWNRMEISLGEYPGHAGSAAK